MLLIALALAAVDPPVRPMEVEVVRDAITDEVRAYAILRDGGNRLVVSCDPAKYDGAQVSFHGRRWLARGNALTGERPVVFRFDSLPPQRSMWDVEDRRGRLSSRRRATSFLGHLMSAEQVVIRARDIEDRPFDMVFRLQEVRPAVEQALAACAADGGAES
jgi:hypothetical protein